MFGNVLPPLVLRVGLIYLIVINLFTLFLFGLDKRRAKFREKRIRERTLMLCAVVGGSVGALFGMAIYHHKTRHKKFKVGIPIILIVQIVLFFLVLFLLKR